MIGFGWTNPFPVNLGGGESIVEGERGALLDGIERELGLSPQDDTENYAETAGEATAVAIIWAISARLRNQAIPERMLEQLTVWEESTGLRPTADDLPIDRRALLAGKMRGQINNAIIDIEEVCQKVLGNNYVEVVQTDESNAVGYWPGVNPGPPGYEWSSNYGQIGVVMTMDGLSNAQILDKRDRLHLELEHLLPSWMSFQIGVGSSFTVNAGIVGRTFL